MSNAHPLVSCPNCRQTTRFSPENRWRPFCSERCRSLDFGAWATEQFRVPGEPLDDLSLGDERPRDLS